MISQKSQYAVRALLELAKRQGSGPVKAADIAAAQWIPVRFLENILGQLRQAGLVESVRGKEGGYRLARPAERVSVGEIIRLVQGPLSPVDCGDGSGCALKAGCVLLPMWQRAHQAMMEVYDGSTLSGLVEEDRAVRGCEVLDYAI